MAARRRAETGGWCASPWREWGGTDQMAAVAAARRRARRTEERIGARNPYVFDVSWRELKKLGMPGAVQTLGRKLGGSAGAGFAIL